ncbi:hypothetical protein [Fulvivirga ligni]|uniref:hypothetical protein n=1 Tax=Fulvivirga ligni TaxID=2904246 RepID=UPI001F428377|nr:hypothetical protein [Fulvivirga ligni]UII22852.1 hypothetical protein LVD16_06405 [Fulvivirga ligni]
MKRVKQMYSSIENGNDEIQTNDHAVICEEKKDSEVNHKKKKKNMKHLLTLIFVLGTIWASAQSPKVPANAQKDFKTKFKNAEQVSWEETENKEFVASFYMEEAEHMVAYDAKGAWLYTSQLIEESDLPEAISEKISDDFIETSIVAAEKRTTAKKESLYIVTLQPDYLYTEDESEESDDVEEQEEDMTAHAIQLTFDASGKLITKKTML